MARIRRWQEKLLVPCLTLLFSMMRSWPLRAYKAANNDHATYSRLITKTSGKKIFGIELAARGPYVRLIRGSLVPVAMPLAPGAFVAMAGATGVPLPAAGAGSGTCSSDPECQTRERACCNLTASTCCAHYCTTHTGRECWQAYCTAFGGGQELCTTCGAGTCANVCATSYC